MSRDPTPPPVSIMGGIKPIAWELEDARDTDFPRWSADVLGKHYSVFKAWWGAENKWGYVFDEFHHTPDEAKAAAQADLEYRVRSILVDAPTPATNPWDHVPCPCTKFEQDEDCPQRFPSLLCAACSGTGNATQETVAALAAEMLKVAKQVDEIEDPFAAWESIELLKSQAPKHSPSSMVKGDSDA